MKEAKSEPPHLDPARYELLVRGAADAIVGTDCSGRILLWNDAASRMFGHSAGSMIGRPILEIIAERFHSDYEKGFAAAITEGRPRLTYLFLVARAADGTEFPVEAGVSIDGRGADAIAIGVVRKTGERFRKLARLAENERRLREAESVARMGSFEWDIASDTLSWSDELDRIYGYPPGINPRTLEAFLERVHPDDRAAVKETIQRSIRSGAAWSMDERIVRADTGEVRVLATRGKASRNARGAVARISGTCHDVTEQRRAEQALALSEARFRRGFDDAPIGMLLVELGGDDAYITRTNKAFTYLVGYTKAQVATMRLSDLVDTEDWPLLLATLERVSHQNSAPPQLEVRLRAANGTAPVVLAAASRIEGESISSTLIVHLEDITVRKQAEEQLRHRALHDPLTGLPNRDLLLDRLGGALARAVRENSSVAVLFLDLDNFKIINDTIGHNAGDEILRTIASRLLAAGRSGDTCARVGGDEFVMVCENVRNEDEIFFLARRVAGMLAAPIAIDGRDFVTSVSIGIAVGHEVRAPEQLVRDADLAMYRAKQRGKNTIEIFDETLRRHAWDRVEIERELRRALSDGEIVPFYQPIVALDDGRIAGFEALARWRHPKRGLLRPHEFLAVAEEAHLISALGTAMLEASCRQLALWRQSAPGLTMAVNLSLRQLDANFAQNLRETLERHAIPPDRLRVEVTESVLIDLQQSAGKYLNALAGIGLCLGIDDFGTGYSSLIYLKRFPVHFLKIDRSFVAGLPHSQEDAAIVEAIIRLGQSLEIATIAEGVETAEQLETLRDLGCMQAQGNFLASPMAADEIDATGSFARRSSLTPARFRRDTT